MLGTSFQQFSIEALLASASLRSGLTALNKCKYHDKGSFGNDSNLLIVFYVQIMPDDLVMQLHRF